MSWRILYIEESDYLSLYLDNVKIKRGVDETVVPLCDLSAIVIDNQTTTVSAPLLTACSEYNVLVAFCDRFHLPQTLLLPLSGNYRSSYVFRRQLEWPAAVLAVGWDVIVRAKIERQALVFRLTGGDVEIYRRLLKFAADVRNADAGNCEGLAAKMYFRALFGESFSRGGDDPINATLNYGYSILRSQIARSVVAHGLNPQLGIFHRGPNNAFNLADDFLEPFRPIVDLWVKQNIGFDSVFNRSIRLDLINLATKKVRIGKQKSTIIQAIDTSVEGFLAFIETGDLDKIVFPESVTYDF
jgi:CRISPR-associated protein Cas1